MINIPNVNLATATCRNARNWKNAEWTWERLAARLGKTVRTAETADEYAAAPKERRAEIKDVGGFVGGYLADGRRKRGCVMSRSLVTLDADFATAGLWEAFTAAWPGVEAVCYSTHSHRPETPRLRLVLPLSREVAPDEYGAIARRVAERVGIDLFDDTTYEAERLMFWPSTPKDGEWVHHVQHGGPLDADKVLATYRDWRDVSAWPVSSRQTAAVRREVKEAEDPTKKRGIVGWFCRAYGVEEAIETFLPEAYTPTDAPGRWTYARGTTTGGAVVYEDKWLYSHHGTDPASGQLLNAFDLVRVHLFSDQDAHCRADVSPTSRPSFKAMAELAAKDGRVRMEMDTEKQRELAEDFGGMLDGVDESAKEGEEAEEDDRSWVAQLERNAKTGDVKPTIPNIRLILSKDKRVAGKVVRDVFAHRDMVIGKLPWREAGGAWGNTDDACLRGWLEANYGVSAVQKTLDAMESVLTEQQRHPVREYLGGLKWDGVPRLDALLIDYLGAEDTPLTRAVTRKAFTACVARVMEPGCKYDYVLVLQGGEGIGKSTLLHVMGGQWFSDSVTAVAGREGMESLLGAWLVELAELMSVRRAEVETTKAYITRQEDEYRPAYGRKKECYPRQCVFFGTTNEENPLRGGTGNRRFWIVRCAGGARLSPWRDLPELRDQLWAEAVARYKAKEPLYLSPTLEALAGAQQKAMNECAADPDLGRLQAYLDALLPADWASRTIEQRKEFFRAYGELSGEHAVPCTVRRDYVCVAEILNECLRTADNGKSRKAEAYRVKQMMEYAPGWQYVEGKFKRFGAYGAQRYYERIVKAGENLSGESDTTSSDTCCVTPRDGGEGDTSDTTKNRVVTPIVSGQTAEYQDDYVL